MPPVSLSSALAAMMLFATPPASQSPESAPAAEAATARGPAVVAALAPGMPVKDKSGAIIGSVLGVSSEEDGKHTATIRIGAESFAIDAAGLSVDDGAVSIDATEAELKSLAAPR